MTKNQRRFVTLLGARGRLYSGLYPPQTQCTLWRATFLWGTALHGVLSVSPF